VPKSTSESQAQITHLLTAPEPARGLLIARFAHKLSSLSMCKMSS